jgi:hypothetical protein
VDLPDIDDKLTFSVFSDSSKLKRDLMNVVMQRIIGQVPAPARR